MDGSGLRGVAVSPSALWVPRHSPSCHQFLNYSLLSRERENNVCAEARSVFVSMATGAAIETVAMGV